MAAKAKTAISWGDLNAALNGLVRGQIILGYSTGMERNSDAPSIEVEIESGADQADAVRRVRESLPGALPVAHIRTRVR